MPALEASYLRSPCKSRGLRMSWKTAVGVLCTVTIILGTYIKFFDHPPADDTLNANRAFGSIKRPSFIKHGKQMVANAELSGNASYVKEYRTLNSSLARVNRTEVSEDLNKPPSNGTREEPAVPSKDEGDVKGMASQEGHGIRKFDWDGWAKENNFVSIGGTWAYCDDEEPILVGKIILFNNDGSLSVSLVLNTTFEADVTHGTMEVKVMYYDTVFYHQSYDICEVAEKYEDDFFLCPLRKGEKYYYREQAISRFMPSGEFNIELSLRDENERTILCGECQLKL